MKGIERITAVLPQFRIGDFRVVKRFDLEEEQHETLQPQRYRLALVLSMGLDAGPDFELTIEFFNVQRLYVRNWGGQRVWLSELRIEDVSSWQHEGVRYRVFQVEDDDLEFVCNEIVFSSVRRI